MICPKCKKENIGDRGFCALCGPVVNTGNQSDSPFMDVSLLPPTLELLKEVRTLANGRFLLVGKISEGGMGKIYLAQDNKMKCMVVIKQMIPNADNKDEINYLAKRFKEEARLLFRLKHASIPRVVDYFIENNSFYMIMEFIEGQNLHQYVSHKQDGKLSVDEAVDLMGKVCSILNFLHKQDPPIIHRDIKPGNIMINKEGEIILVDFGLARSLDRERISTAMVGTLGFSSPEHYTGKFLLSSDLYCLGATFHYLLSGESPGERLPFDFPPLARYRDDIHYDLQKLFDNLLNSDPKKRYSTVDEAIKDIQKIKETEYPDTIINWEKLLFESDDNEPPQAETIINDNSREIPAAVEVPPAPAPPVLLNPPELPAEEQKEKEIPIKKTKKRKVDRKPEKEQESETTLKEKRITKKEERISAILSILKILVIVMPVILLMLLSIYFIYPVISLQKKEIKTPPPLPDIVPSEILITVNPENISGSTIIITNENDKNFGYMGKRIYKADDLMREGPSSFSDGVIHIQVPPGFYTVMISKQGFKNINLESRNISKGLSLEMQGHLEEIPPEIIITTNVEADIYVNKEKIGTASEEKPLAHSVKSGDQLTVTASKDGYESAGEGPFTMKPDETRKINLMLEKVYIPSPYPTYKPTK